MRKEQFTQSVYPQEDRGSRCANKRPDSICPGTTSLIKLGIVIPANCRSSQALFEVSDTVILDARGPVRAKSVAPIVIRPLLTPREIPVGGIRTIGGGTSQEAVRRAKRKTRRRS